MLRMKTHAQKNCRGFTLIELLVVISIIALLLSILMPSLNSVKESARQLVCSTNLKSLSLGSILFASDNDDWLPMTDGSSLGDINAGDANKETVAFGRKYPQRSYWYVDIAAYMDVAKDPYISAAKSNHGGWYAAESQGINAPGVLVCPSIKRTMYNTKGLAYGWNWNGMGYKCKDYFLNGSNSGAEGYWAPRKTSSVKSAYITGIIGENPLGVDPVLEQSLPRHFWGGEVWSSYAGGSNQYFFYGDRHKGGSSYICVDGHIEFRKVEEYIDDYVTYRYEKRTKGGGIIFPNPRTW